MFDAPQPKSFSYQSISAKMRGSRLDRRMAFFPKGQADRNQIRRAWVAMQRGPVSEGRSALPAELPSRGRSIQAGSLSYTHGLALKGGGSDRRSRTNRQNGKAQDN